MTRQPWATVTPTWNGVELRFGCSDESTFSEMLVDLKDRISSHDRRWHPETRTWWVAAQAEWRLDEWREVWGTLDEPPPAGRRRHTRRAVDEDGTLYDQLDPRRLDYATLHLLPSAPPELVRSAFRTLTQLHHPDHGGDTATMRLLIEAYERLKEPA